MIGKEESVQLRILRRAHVDSTTSFIPTINSYGSISEKVHSTGTAFVRGLRWIPVEIGDVVGSAKCGRSPRDGSIAPPLVVRCCLAK